MECFSTGNSCCFFLYCHYKELAFQTSWKPSSDSAFMLKEACKYKDTLRHKNLKSSQIIGTKIGGYHMGHTDARRRSQNQIVQDCAFSSNKGQMTSQADKGSLLKEHATNLEKSIIFGSRWVVNIRLVNINRGLLEAFSLGQKHKTYTSVSA